MENKEEFLQKFKSLLNEYNILISIGSSYCSDWHGVNDVCLVVSQRIPNSFNHIDILSVEGQSLDSNDI